MKTFTHITKEGNAKMVDISKKRSTARVAIAKGSVVVGEKILKKIKANKAKKGDVLNVARIAGIMAAKKTSQLIPLCHSLEIDSISIEFSFNYKKNCVNICATSKIHGKTGVEMEALTAVSVTALTIYDMCKSLEKSIEITNIKLIHKSGGKSGTYKNKS